MAADGMASSVIRETSPRKTGKLSLRGDAQHLLAQRRQRRNAHRKIGQPGRNGRQMGPLIHESERVMRQRMTLALIEVREELRLPGGHIHTDRALCLTGLAGETEVKRFLYLLILPAVLDNVTLHHLPKQVSAAAGRVLLFPSGHVAGAHGSVVDLPAGAYPDATAGGLAE